MGSGKRVTTATTVTLVVAMTALAIAISSNAWVMFKYRHDFFEHYDTEIRLGLWEFCICDNIVDDIPSGYRFGEGSSFGIHSEEKEEDTPTWYRVSQGCAVLSQLLLITTAIMVFINGSTKKGIFIARIILCVCSVIAIFATVALFGDQFRKNEFEPLDSSEPSYIEPHWGIGLAISALLLTSICTVLSIVAYKCSCKGDVGQTGSSSCNPSDALNTSVRLLILIANSAMAIAIASPTWMKYVPTTSDSGILSYGLWERCSCEPVYITHRIVNMIEESDDDFPVWLSACQWCANFGLYAMTIAFLLQFVCLVNLSSDSKKLRMTVRNSLVIMWIAGALMAASIVVYLLEYKSMEFVKTLKDLGFKPHMANGLFVNMGALAATVLAFIFGIIDLCIMSRS